MRKESCFSLVYLFLLLWSLGKCCVYGVYTIPDDFESWSSRDRQVFLAIETSRLSALLESATKTCQESLQQLREAYENQKLTDAELTSYVNRTTPPLEKTMSEAQQNKIKSTHADCQKIQKTRFLCEVSLSECKGWAEIFKKHDASTLESKSHQEKQYLSKLESIKSTYSSLMQDFLLRDSTTIWDKLERTHSKFPFMKQSIHGRLIWAVENMKLNFLPADSINLLHQYSIEIRHLAEEIQRLQTEETGWYSLFLWLRLNETLAQNQKGCKP